MRRWLPVVAFLISMQILAQQNPPPGNPTSGPSAQGSVGDSLPPVTKDSRAVALINQVLDATGSTSSSSMTDFTCTGTVTEHKWNGDVQGTVTIRGKDLNLLRIDTTTSAGTRSEITNRGFRARDESGKLIKPESRTNLSATRMILPYLPLQVALQSPAITLSYYGTTEVDNHSVIDIQLRYLEPGSNFNHSLPNGGPSAAQFNTTAQNRMQIDYFIDPATFQVLMMQDYSIQSTLPHQTRYTNYQTSAGVLVPFSISERLGNRDTRSIQITAITFNQGLSNSEFVF